MAQIVFTKGDLIDTRRFRRTLEPGIVVSTTEAIIFSQTSEDQGKNGGVIKVDIPAEAVPLSERDKSLLSPEVSMAFRAVAIVIS